MTWLQDAPKHYVNVGVCQMGYWVSCAINFGMNDPLLGPFGYLATCHANRSRLPLHRSKSRLRSFTMRSPASGYLWKVGSPTAGSRDHVPSPQFGVYSTK